MDYRKLGSSGLEVSAVALGGWPIAGMTSPGANERDSLATIRAALEIGINHFDTAFCYGADGESERLIAKALGSRREGLVVATKGGIHWDAEGRQVVDAAPATLRRECETSLRRLQRDHVELLYLHAPDRQVPVSESAGELARLKEEGKALAIGASNLSLAQLEEFAAACPLAAFQPPYNMLQRQIEADTLPWCRQRGVAVMVYWPLMKGLLSGRLPRSFTPPPDDNRKKYPMYHGEEWQKNQDFIERLKRVAQDAGHTVAELVINWTIHQPGITAALCGAKRPDQIRETAGGAGWRLSDAQLQAIERALVERGIAAVRSPV